MYNYSSNLGIFNFDINSTICKIKESQDKFDIELEKKNICIGRCIGDESKILISKVNNCFELDLSIATPILLCFYNVIISKNKLIITSNELSYQWSTYIGKNLYLPLNNENLEISKYKKYSKNIYINWSKHGMVDDYYMQLEKPKYMRTKYL